MKQAILLLGTAILFLLSGCKKNLIGQKQTGDDEILAAKQYFDQTVGSTSFGSANPRFSPARFVNWGKAEKVAFSTGKAVIAPVQYPRSFYLRSSLDSGRLYLAGETNWVCIWRDKQGRFRVEQVGFFPD